MRTPVNDVPRAVPEPTLRRLPLYHRYLRRLQETRREFVSCTDIGLELELDPTQIRKDLEAAGIPGRPRVGYVLGDVVDGIERFLGWKDVQGTFLVGAGSMGAALLGHSKFAECGIEIVAAFDADPAKIGALIHGRRVRPIGELPEQARRLNVLLGILTVPAGAAQSVAELMVRGGIRAIWNFAPIQLRLPEGVIVHNEDLYCSFASLSQKLAEKLRGTGAAPTPRSNPAASTGSAPTSLTTHKP